MEIVSDDLDRARDLIRGYCRRGGRSGGMLMICGPRGVGKTRLVDEALCLPGRMGTWQRFLTRLAGDHGGRRRKSVQREPRALNRYLLKVEIDPYFPEAAEQSTTVTSMATAGEEVRGRRESYGRRRTDFANARDNSGQAFQMLRNLVFALSSTLDPRRSRRRNGRTLRDKLGACRYWFSSNALWWPEENSCKTLPLVVWLVWSLVITANLFWSAPSQSRWDVLAGFTYLPASMILAWMVLRWLDWNALHRTTRQLYDLVHAQNFDLKKDNETTSSMELKQRWSLVAGLLLVLLAFGVEVGPKALEGWYPAQGKGVEANAGYFMFEQDKPRRPDATVDEALRTGIASALVFLLGAGLLFYSRRAREEVHSVSTYGQKNPVWMVSLLRRYLYMAHRCGIEPVLVFDELDKLEQPFALNDPGQGKQISLALFPSLDRLEQFLNTMLRLRQSVGADFLSVLIGGPRLYQALYDHRWGQHIGSGVLGTLIQYEIVLGPVRPAKLKEALETEMDSFSPSVGDRSGAADCLYQCFYPESRESTGVTVGQRARPVDPDWIWVESRGLLSNIQRMRGEQPGLVGVDFRVVRLIAEQVDHLWEPGIIEREFLSRFFSVSRDGASKRLILRDPWRILWVRMGMARMAWELARLAERPLDFARVAREFAVMLGERLPDDPWVIMENQYRLINKALEDPDHEVLVFLGRVLLVIYFQDFYLESDGEDGGIKPLADTGFRVQFVPPKN